MPNTQKTTKWLLTNVPEDIIIMVRDYQTKKMKECNCRFGVGQSIFNLLRKGRQSEVAKLQDDRTKN